MKHLVLLGLMVGIVGFAVILSLVTANEPLEPLDSVETVNDSSEHICLENGSECTGTCDSESETCGPTCGATMGLNCTCDEGSIPNSGVITCSGTPSMI